MNGEAKELDKTYFRKCDSPPCKSFAFITDWAGWKWCLKHFIRNMRYDERKWQKLKWARINWRSF